MGVHLQDGLFDLCRRRILEDKEFQAVAVNRNFNRIDSGLFDEYRLFQLKRTLKLVNEKSRFYCNLFKEKAIDIHGIKSISDLANLPFTTPEDLSKDAYSFLCTSQGDVEKPVTFYSSGTSGLRKRIFFSKADVMKIMQFLPRGMNTVVGRDEASIQVFLQNSQGRGTGKLLADSLESFGMKAFISDLRDSAENIIKVTKDNNVNVWFGDAVTIFRITKELGRMMDLSEIGMKCVFLTMSNISKPMVKYLTKAWNCPVSTHYGLTEMGWGLAVDCDICRGYHYNELDVIAEVVDLKTGAILPEGVAGELVFTSIARDCMPLIRYRSGDISSMKSNRCNRHLQVIQRILRRKEGSYTLANAREISPVDIEDVVFGIDEVVDYRAFGFDGRLMLQLEVLELNWKAADGHATSNGMISVADRVKVGLLSLDVMKGCEEPLVELLPYGSLRRFCYEKKRICIYKPQDPNMIKEV